MTNRFLVVVLCHFVFNCFQSLNFEHSKNLRQIQQIEKNKLILFALGFFFHHCRHCFLVRHSSWFTSGQAKLLLLRRQPEPSATATPSASASTSETTLFRNVLGGSCDNNHTGSFLSVIFLCWIS